MTRRIVIPVEEKTGLTARLAQHFGYAPFFAIVDLDENNNVLKIDSEDNQSEHVGGAGHPHEHLLTLKPDIFIVAGMGTGCLMSLVSSGVMVLQAQGSTVDEIINLYKQGKLNVLKGGCQHNH
ncbi:MAG: hypothetical protein GX638_15330 [Crenarchaeota archaeon]|nr:hypothetical protein [Thermoproteota archaeon]